MVDLFYSGYRVFGGHPKIKKTGQEKSNSKRPEMREAYLTHLLIPPHKQLLRKTKRAILFTLTMFETVRICKTGQRCAGLDHSGKQSAGLASISNSGRSGPGPCGTIICRLTQRN